MSFYLYLAAFNVVCFVPLLLLASRRLPSPWAAIRAMDWSNPATIPRLFYSRYESADPFRINLEFTLLMLIAAGTGSRALALEIGATAMLVLGFMTVLYTAIMQCIFKRPPMLVSDLALLRSGIALAQRQIYWMLPLVALLFAAIVYLAYSMVALLFALLPPAGPTAFAAAAALLVPGLYNWRRFFYEAFIWRVVYSPSLHLYRNVLMGRSAQSFLSKGAAYFTRHNHYEQVELDDPPNIVIVCVESYGSLVLRDEYQRAWSGPALRAHERKLASAGYAFASTCSAAPLFAGGSWLSYVALTYGLPISDLRLFERLFSEDSNFSSYESLFHVLARNGYDNVLLCPLGGIDANTVDWRSLDRCFQPKHKITFDQLEYRGPRVNYLGLLRRYSALDQYSLGFGYDFAKQRCKMPFSLFFCTLNSHYPWHTKPSVVDDWRTLNDPTLVIPEPDDKTLRGGYAAAIQYQLDMVMSFVAARAGDSPLVIVFGDHQPPFLTPTELGPNTPIHVLSKNRRLVNVFEQHGFASGLDLTALDPEPIRHEAFLSILMRAMQEAYGKKKALSLPYLPRGAQLFAASGQ